MTLRGIRNTLDNNYFHSRVSHIDNNNIYSYKTLWRKRKHQNCLYNCCYWSCDLLSNLLSAGKWTSGSDCWWNCMANFFKMVIQDELVKIDINCSNHMDHHFNTSVLLPTASGPL